MGMACGDSSSGDASDAGAEAAIEASPVDAAVDQNLPPDTDASKKSCLLDNGDDPVLLCTQKLVLRSVHDAVLVANKGVLASWDSTTFAPDGDGHGGYAHDVHDDVAYARACAAYAASAERYGDTELTQTVDLDLVTLAPLVRAELATVPDEYGGDLYDGLRAVAVGLRVLNRTDDASALDAIADNVGRSIFAHFVPLSGSSLDGGAGDAGDAGPPEAGATDAGDAGALPAGDGVLASDKANKDYAPDLVATGAVALLDMAARHATDDPNAAAYVSAAQQSLDHVYLRGRDPTTHLYFRSLVPGAGATTDDLSPRAPFPGDLLATETAGRLAYALLRAHDLVASSQKNGGPLTLLASYPFVARANEAIAALNGTPSLYDADLGGYYEGWVPSSSTLLTNKTTRANALIFSAIHRADVVGVSPYGPQLKLLRTVLSARTPEGAGILAAVSGQSAFFASVAKDYRLPPASYAIGDAGDAGALVAHPNSYVTAAVMSAVGAYEEEWVGYP
jgi:hypothetical protein